MASNPQIEAVPVTQADPYNRILRYVQAQFLFHPLYFSEGKIIGDEYKQEYAIEEAARKEREEEERRAKRREKDRERRAMGGSSSQRTGASGSSGGGMRGGSGGSGMGSRRAGGIKNKMRDRFGNLPEEQQDALKENKSTGNKRDREADRIAPRHIVGMDKENLGITSTPKLLTKKEIEAQHRAEADRQGGADIDAVNIEMHRGKPILGESTAKQDRACLDSTYPDLIPTEKEGGKRRRVDRDEQDAEAELEKKRHGKKAKLDENDGVVRGKRTKEKNYGNMDGQDPRGVGSDDEERDARLEARKIKRRAKASVLHAKPIEPITVTTTKRESRPKATTACAQATKAKDQPASDSEEEEERSLIKLDVSPAARDRTRDVKATTGKGKSTSRQETNGAKSMVKRSVQERPKSESNSKSKQEQKQEKEKTISKVNIPSTRRNVSVLAMLNAEGAGRPNGRITLGPRRGVFAKGIASANLPVRSWSRSKVPPVPDLAFCESTFLSRPPAKTATGKKGTVPPPPEEVSSSEEVGSECDNKGSGSEEDESDAESSELSSAPSSGRDVKPGNPEARVVSAGSPSMSEVSSSRVKTRPPVKAMQAAEAGAVSGDGSMPSIEQRTAAAGQLQQMTTEIEHAGGRISPDWPSGLPDEDDTQPKQIRTPIRDVPKRTRLGRGRLSLLPPVWDSAFPPARARADRTRSYQFRPKAQIESPGAVEEGPSVQPQVETSTAVGEDSLMAIIQDAIAPTSGVGIIGQDQLDLVMAEPAGKDGYVNLVWADMASDALSATNKAGPSSMYEGEEENGRQRPAWQDGPLQAHDAQILYEGEQAAGRYVAEESHGLERVDDFPRGRASVIEHPTMAVYAQTPGDHVHLAPEWEDSELEGSSILTDEAELEHANADVIMAVDDFAPSMGVVRDQEEVLDMFGTTEAEAKKLWQNGRRIA